MYKIKDGAIVAQDEDHMTVEYATTIEYYDIELAEDIIPLIMKRTDFYGSRIGKIALEKVTGALREIFIQGKYMLCVSGIIHFCLSGAYAGAGKTGVLNTINGQTYLGHPTLRRYHDFGNYAFDVRNCLIDGDVERALLLGNCIVKSFSFGDAEGLRGLCNDLWEYRKEKIIVTKLGDSITPEEIWR